MYESVDVPASMLDESRLVLVASQSKLGEVIEYPTIFSIHGLRVWIVCFKSPIENRQWYGIL